VRKSKRLALLLTTLMIGGLSGSLAVQPSALAETVSSAGPLTAIEVTPDLNCAVKHAADPSNGAFYNNTACGTFVAVNGRLFGPAVVPAGFYPDENPLLDDIHTAFTPVSQSVTGTGGAVRTIVTVVDLGTTGLSLTETDTYTVGQETYQTDVQLANNGTGAVNAIVYRAGDCNIHGSDDGYGMVGPAPGSIACTTRPAPNTGGELVRWTPITAGSLYRQGRYDSLWATIRDQKPFNNTCLCTDYPQDDAAGLSWSVNVPVNGASEVSSLITFSLGAVQTDLSVTLNDSPDPVAPGANLSYTTIVTNAGPGAAGGVNLSIETPASTSFVSLLPNPLPAGWACTTPQPGGRAPVTCNRSSLAVGAPQAFTVAVKVDPGPGGPIVSRASVSSSTADTNQANNSDTETTTVAAPPAVAATDRLMAVGLTAYLPGTGGATLQAKPDDIVRFSPAANNTYSMVFQGDDVGLTGATIDALAVDPVTKDLILSFTLARTVTGIGTVQREDLVAFHPTSLGATTQGTFRLFFDGSDIGLTAGTDENIDAVDVGPTGTIYFSTQGPFDIRSGSGPRRTGNDKDIVACTAPSLGNASACSGLSTYRFGSSLGLTTSTENVDAFDLTAEGDDLVSTTGNYDVNGSAGYGTDALTCRAGACSRFFTGSAHSLLRLADIETGTLLP
jgi:uncharacterized repeat protein (TIGR01451 family)